MAELETTNPGESKGKKGLSGAQKKTVKDSSFWQLWEENSPYLYQLCKKWVGPNQQEAEDALSGSMLRAWESMADSSKEIINPQGWLIRVTRNYCMDLLRAGKRRAGATGDPDTIPGRDRKSPSDHSESPEETLLRREMYFNLREAIIHLPEKLRESVILRCFKGMPYGEIARQLKLSNENVRKRVQQGRKALKGRMEAYLAGKDKSLAGLLDQGSDEEPQVAESAGNLQQPEFRDKAAWSMPARVRRADGGEKEYPVFSAEKPLRLGQKLNSLNKYIEKYPSGWRKRLERAEIFFLTGDWARAKEEYRAVIEKQPHLLEPSLNLIRILMQEEEWDQALEICGIALRQSLGPSTRLHLKGLSQFCRGKFLEADQEFRQAIVLGPGELGHWHELIRLRAHSQQAPQVLEATQSLLNLDPGNRLALYFAMKTSSLYGFYEETTHLLEQGDVSGLEDYYLLKTHLHWRIQKKMIEAGSPEKTETHALLRHLRDMAPMGFSHRELRVEFLFYQGNISKCWEELQKIRQEFPRHQGALLCYARWSLRLGRPEEGLASLRKLTEYFLDDPGVALLCLKIFPFARKPWLKAEVLAIPGRFKSHSIIQSLSAKTLLKRKLWTREMALDAATHALSLPPYLPESQLHLAEVQAESGLFSSAIRTVEIAWESPHRTRSPWVAARLALLTGRLQKKQGRENTAQIWLEEALHYGDVLLKHRPALGFWVKAQAWKSLGRKEQAESGFREARAAGLFFPLSIPSTIPIKNTSDL